MAHDHEHAAEDPGDQHICVCFHVPRRKVEAYCRRERPRVASLLSECLGAGSGCGWCVPFLRALHRSICEGGEAVALPPHEEYLRRRKEYHKEKGIQRE